MSQKPSEGHAAKPAKEAPATRIDDLPAPAEQLTEEAADDVKGGITLSPSISGWKNSGTG